MPNAKVSLGLLVCALSAGCPGPAQPPVKDPPVVTITPEQPNLADTRYRLQITVTGCDPVSALTLSDRGRVLKQVPFSANPATVELLPADVSFKDGISAPLAFTATATCADGRMGSSIPTTGTFFPIAKAILPPDGFPELFFAEGSGTSATFTGCGLNAAGVASYFKLDATGKVVKTNEALPFPCTYDTQISKRDATSDKRWFFDPDEGAYTLDSNLVVKETIPSLSADLAMLPGGNALRETSDTLYLERRGGLDDPATGTVDESLIWQHTTADGTPRWMGQPVVKAGTISVPVEVFDALANQSKVALWSLPLASAGLDEQPITEQVLFPSAPSSGLVHPAALRADVGAVYFASFVTQGFTQIVACPLPSTGCDGKQKWQTADLEGTAERLVLFANDTRLAVVGKQQVWVLDTATGAVLNPSSRPFRSTGALEVRRFVHGPGEDFYFVGAPPGNALGTELVGFATAASGELFRYAVPAGTLAFDVDGGGSLWLRSAGRLLQLNTVAEYEALKAR